MFKRIRRAYIEWLARRLPDCDTTTRMISDAMDRQLTFTERWQVRLHNYYCTYCARYARQLMVMRRALRQREQRNAQDSPLPGTPSLSPEARERLKRKLSRQE